MKAARPSLFKVDLRINANRSAGASGSGPGRPQSAPEQKQPHERRERSGNLLKPKLIA